MNSNRKRAGRKVRLSRSRWRRSLVSFPGTLTPLSILRTIAPLIGANFASLNYIAVQRKFSPQIRSRVL